MRRTRTEAARGPTKLPEAFLPRSVPQRPGTWLRRGRRMRVPCPCSRRRGQSPEACPRRVAIHSLGLPSGCRMRRRAKASRRGKCPSPVRLPRVLQGRRAWQRRRSRTRPVQFPAQFREAFRPQSAPRKPDIWPRRRRKVRAPCPCSHPQGRRQEVCLLGAATCKTGSRRGRTAQLCRRLRRLTPQTWRRRKVRVRAVAARGPMALTEALPPASAPQRPGTWLRRRGRRMARPRLRRGQCPEVRLQGAASCSLGLPVGLVLSRRARMVSC
mmetsp:Transcript_37648/g.108248  ORF Transcript_37648/g.108248 Transcript_37648/m.108248 type:complete len:270 (+) Transcript_37648:744-1553(+)